MIRYPNNTILIQSLSELPNLAGSSKIVLDFETTSGNAKLASTNPWFNCDVLGTCICNHDSPGYYIPIGHKHATPHTPNLDKQLVRNWLFDVLAECNVLIGHHVKYDAHVLQNCMGIKVPDNCILYDTLTQAKIIDSDRLSYGLDVLSRDWLGRDISQYEHAFNAYLFSGKGIRVNKDYGEIPANVLAPYGGQDVLTTRELKQYIEAAMPESCKLVASNEVKLTKILLKMEDVGLCINSQQVQIKQIQTQYRLIQIMDRIGELTGRMIRPNVSDDCYKLLCGEYGLPILKWTNEDDNSKVSNPSFDKDTMKSYLIHPLVQENSILKEVVELIKEYKILDQFNNLFLNSFIECNINGIMHPTYNQAVRTARLSCSDPNAQQMSKLAKELIIVPDDDWMIVDVDLSQIEFRLIASTLNNQAIIAQYNTDPSTDYHAYVSQVAGIDRDSAKSLNFAVGYGAGRKKAVSMVSRSLDIASQGYKDSGMAFDTYCQMRAENMYNSYHRILPELKPTIRKSEQIAKKYGYIANLYGRYRKLPIEGCYKAFNAYVQSSAADLAKHLSILIDEYIKTCSDEIKLIGVIHDSWLLYIRKNSYLQHCAEIRRIIEEVKTPNLVRVPILCNIKVSGKSWSNVKETGNPV